MRRTLPPPSAAAAIVARVRRRAFRLGLAAVRASGWRGPVLAFASYLPIAVLGSVLGGALLVFGLVAHVVVLLALVRVLGAHRPEPLPPQPQVDELGRRVLAPRRQGPALTAEDRRPRTALRNAATLWRPAISVTALYLLAAFAAGLAAVALSGGKVGEYGPGAQLVAVLPMSAVFTAFVALVPQRVALEGDTRVLVAAAHSVRIARTAYGALLLLTVAEPAVAAAGALALPGKHPPASRVVVVGTLTIAVATIVKLLVTATATEVYVAGPRLDLAVDPAGRQPL
jgi:hypothetical protein